MKHCPDKDTIALLLEEGIGGQERAALLAHVKECQKCRAIVQRLENLKSLLAMTREDEKGNLHIEVPELDEESSRAIRDAAVAAFDASITKEKKAEALIKEIRDYVAALRVHIPDQQPEFEGGYASIKPDKRGARTVDADEDELVARIMALLHVLLGPDISPSIAKALARRLLAEPGSREGQRP